MIAVYVTGHGFGHATRTAEVLRAVRARDASLPITVCSTAPGVLFESQVEAPLTIRPLACDVGVVQRGALVVDEAATVEHWLAFQQGQPARVAAEAAWLRASAARVVAGDVPPLAFAAAAAAGIPSVGITNFSWDWIYRHIARREPELHAAADAAAADYARAHLLLQLPFAGDLSAFPVRQTIPLVARRPRFTRAAARERLGIVDETRPLVLVSFGGVGLPGFEPARLASTPGCSFLVEPHPGPLPANVRALGLEERVALGLGYPDVVAAADVVLSKPGYGIVSDCVAAGTRLVYTDRGDFPEYDVMVREMPDWLPVEYAAQAAVFGGAVDDLVERVMARAWPAARRIDGADVAAERLLGLAG